jgi:cellulose synthase/poly-beta-1,6-N-acetylglucosamine synthase-like glycosyltransferase
VVPAAPNSAWLLWPLAICGVLALAALLLTVAQRSWRRQPEPLLVSVLMVAKNKERIIEGLVRGLAALNCRLPGGGRCEIVVVDDHSTDQTGAILDRLARFLPATRTVHLADLRSNGSTPIEIGVFMCSSPVVLLLNLDGHTHPRMLLHAVARLLASGQCDPAAGALGPAASAITRIRANGVPFQGKERVGRTSN